MAITIKCANCLQAVPGDNTFCIFCGARLDMEPAVKPSSTTAARTCPNGHAVDNLALGFCPVCGVSLNKKDASVVLGKSRAKRISARICGNGHRCEDPELLFCPDCGLPLNGDRPSPEPKSPPSPDIPKGMVPPTDADLMRKH